MYVRWKTRKTTLYCYLCQSKRHKGKPVSSTLGYLGSCQLNPTPAQQQVFWEQVAMKLNRYELSKTDRFKIESAISSKLSEYNPCMSDGKPEKIPSTATSAKAKEGTVNQSVQRWGT